MNYIYDIYLNLNKILYDSFDWNKNDKIIHIRKIPVIKISNDSLKELISNKICLNNELLFKIYNTTEVWNINTKIPYCALFCDDNNTVSIEFNNKGESIRKSYLLVDDELEILEIIKRLNEKNIEFKILNKEKNIFKTRKQIKDEDFIHNELKSMDENKLNYIYFECFGKKEKNKNIILNNIKKLTKNSKTYKNLYDILKLTSTTKK